MAGEIDRGKIHKLGSIRARELSSGLKLDQYEVSDILWKDGNNIQFTPHGVRKISGYTSFFNSPGDSPIRGMVDANTSGTQYLYYGDQTNLYQYTGGGSAVSVGSGYTGNESATVNTPATTWSLVNYGSWILATNGVDAPQIFKGTSFAALNTDSMFSTAEIFVVRGPHVIGFNTSEDPKEIIWCDEDDPETWLPDTDNAAGSLLIREMEGEIKAAVPLGDRIAVYGQDQMFLLNYSGTPFYFGYKPALSSIGAVSKKAVIPRGRMNYGLGRHGFWQTDGVNFSYIDDPDIKQYAQDNINWTQASKVHGYHDEENNQVVWYVPTNTGEPDEYLAYDYVRNVWSKGSTTFTSSLPREVFTYPVVADKDGDVFFNNFGDDADGGAIGANVITTAVSLGEPDLIKEITAIRVGYVGSGLTFRIGTSETAESSISWGSYTEVPDGFEFSPQRLAGRYIHLDFTSLDTGDAWELQAIDFHGRMGGTR